MKVNYFVVIICILKMLLVSPSLLSQNNNSPQDEKYRPKIHFTPKEHWINDPNGMLYYKGIYHLFFQHHPYSSVWGPMHWGHATSTDLIHWKHEPIALYPDSLGTIFSGSAVIDKYNTSGFGEKGQAPMVAIFTQHNSKAEKEGRNNFQNQSIAYSVDDGKTWIKYKDNPVVKNPGIRDFRDPKVIWYEPQKKWIMVLATKDNIEFYSSPDLKNWIKESDFGDGKGAHGGGWECPDLVMLSENGKQHWVLIVNLNPGAPNAGSGTQYFVGDFDGKKFTSNQTNTRWMDYGPDNYAGVTWSNTGQRKILIGWMSNWMYANLVPTETWKNALTIPRELKLIQIGKDLMLASLPIQELSGIQSIPITVLNLEIKNHLDLTSKIGAIKFPSRINLSFEQAKDFSLVIANDKDEEITIGFEKENNRYFIDRTKSGITDFQAKFAARHFAPRITNKSSMNISLLIDVSSVELFADNGLTVMTEIFFPRKPYHLVHINTKSNLSIKKIEYGALKSIL